MKPSFFIRNARRSDAADMAILDDMASGGLVSWLWTQEVSAGRAEHAFTFGRSQMARRDIPHGYCNCRIGESDEEVSGMATSYEMPVFEPDADLPAPLRPIMALMALASGTWYIDSLAVYPQHRRRRIAASLVEDCFARARIESDAAEVSLIVRDDNEAALRLYRRQGFELATRKSYVAWSGERAMARDLVLLTAKLEK